MDMSDAVIVKSSRLKSVVWNDFDRIKKDDVCLAVCRHCKKKLSGSSTSGTSHLRNHLIRCQRRNANGLPQLFNPREKKKEMPVAIASYNPDHEQRKDEVLNLVNFRFEQEQMKEDSVAYAHNSFDQRRSRFDLARMIILHGYSLGMVDHVGFKVFVKNLQPLFDLVNCNVVEADCMEIYMKEKQKVSEVLDKLPGKISLSADKWTSLNNTEFLCLTAHYIDESWQLHKKILNFIAVNPCHTEDLHSEVIMTCLMDWDIDRKLLSMTFDNCPTNDGTAARISNRLSQNRFLYSNGRLFDVRCAVSLIFTMVQDALISVNEVAFNIRESIRYVKSSQTVHEKFNEIIQEAEFQSQKGLCLDNPLRWDSSWTMLEAALEHRELFALLQEKDPCYTFHPSDLEWERLSVITSYLKFFVEITSSFTRTKVQTANLYFPDLCDTYLQLNEWSKNPDEFISALASKMRGRFEEYWERCSLSLAVAAMLDPRFKMKLVEYYYAQIFGSGAPSRIDDVFEAIRALYNEHSVCLASLDQGMTWQEGGGPGGPGRDRLVGFDKFLHETSQTEGAKSDLNKYMEEPLFPRNAEFSVLNWWKVHTPRYPILSMMARNVLGIPVVKASPEAAFGTGGLALNRSWGSLSAGTLQALVCSQDWIRSELES